MCDIMLLVTGTGSARSYLTVRVFFHSVVKDKLNQSSHSSDSYAFFSSYVLNLKNL